MPERNAAPEQAETHLALQRIPHEKAEDRATLEQVAMSWLFHLEQGQRPRAMQYFENASYLLGNHSTRYFYTSQQGFGTAAIGGGQQGSASSVAKIADNKLIRPVETVGGMLNQNAPEPRVSPNSSMPADEDAAELGEMYLRLVYEKPLDLPRKLRDAAKVAMICGTVVAETIFDDTGIPTEEPQEKVVRRKNPYHKLDPDEPEFIEKIEPDGSIATTKRDIQVRIWTPFHITADPDATTPEELTWIARTTYEDVTWIRESFSGDAPEGFEYFEENLDTIRTENTTNHLLYWWLRFQDILESPQYFQQGSGLAPQTFTHMAGSVPNKTLFTVIDVKPSLDFPRGRTLYFAGGKLVAAGEARTWSEEYPDRWHPYSFFSWFTMPGRFIGLPLLSELVPLQKKINAIDALVHANRTLMATGQWKIPKHSKVAEGAITGIPGVHLKYTDVPGMNEPERIEHVPLPAELLMERDQLIESINLIAATGMTGEDASSPSGLRAGVMLDYYRSEKLRSKSGMIQDWEAFIEGISQNILIEAQLNLTEDNPELTLRMRAAAREYSGQTIESFTGTSLRDHHSVLIDISSSLLHTPEARQARALEFWQFAQGNATPAVMDMVLRAAGLDEFMKAEHDLALKAARRMVARITAGYTDAFIPMPGIDKPEVMAPEFQKALLSDKKFDWPQEVIDTLWQAFDYYTEQAQIAAQQAFEAQIAQVQAMAAAQGAVKQAQDAATPEGE